MSHRSALFERCNFWSSVLRRIKKPYIGLGGKEYPDCLVISAWVWDAGKCLHATDSSTDIRNHVLWYKTKIWEKTRRICCVWLFVVKPSGRIISSFNRIDESELINTATMPPQFYWGIIDILLSLKCTNVLIWCTYIAKQLSR